jgi:alpha-ribazole phosphatase
MDLHIIRHTRLAIDGGRCYGQSEVALADSFDAERTALAAQLQMPVEVVYSSPSQRCTQLAQHFGDAVHCDERLQEYHFGDWEMMRWDDIDKATLDAWMRDFVNLNPPGGENLVQMYARVSAFLEHLRQLDHQRCLLVTHAGVIRCIWAYLLNIPLGEIFKLGVGYGDILHCKLAADPQQDVIYTGNPAR